jgi:sorting nexin-29
VEHHTKNESKKYYKRIQDVTQEFKPGVNACRDANGKMLTEKEDILRRWKEYFESALTAEPDDTDSMIFFTAENEDIEPSYEKVTHVIKCLKNHKAPGTDQILAELLKKGGETLWRRIHHLIKLIWVQLKMPEKWSMGIIQPIYKKRDKLECSNYRTITLLKVTYKVLLGILNNRLIVYAEEILGEYQCRFCANHSTIDHIFTLRQTQEKAYEYNIHLHNLFLDFKQAVDSVNRDRMLKDLMILGIPKKLVQLISVIMAGSKATVRVDNQYTSTFPITNGVRHGDDLSSILFDLVLEAIPQKMNITGHTGTKSTQIFAYADDVAIVSRNKKALKDTPVNTESEARKRGLRINENKTKYMEVTRAARNSGHLHCGKYEFEHVKEFTYLGSQLNQTPPVVKSKPGSLAETVATMHMGN